MTEPARYFDPETLAKIQGLQLRARHIVEGYVSGLHRSPYHGYSIEFAEHREYVPGDDLRYVDWKVFGKTDKVYLKQYEEETNLISYVLLDTSESMAYRGPDAAMSKLDFAKCLAASLAYLVLQQQDSVGLVTFDAKINTLLRSSTNPSHLKQILHVLEDSPPTEKTSIGPIFHDLAERLKKRGVVIVLSDLLDNVDSLLAGLKHFRHRRHEVILFHTLDPAELDFPFRQTMLFKGLEGNPELLTDPASLRDAYLRQLNAYLKSLKTGCLAQRADYHLVRTDQAFDTVLSNCLAPRMSKMN
ncbi:MAG: DUF58 domain-containing protein [Planctomycetales bacterium]|nr:DUF58 domain-containing protein [Planctomycetales bacterium]